MRQRPDMQRQPCRPYRLAGCKILHRRRFRRGEYMVVLYQKRHRPRTAGNHHPPVEPYGLLGSGYAHPQIGQSLGLLRKRRGIAAPRHRHVVLQSGQRRHLGTQITSRTERRALALDDHPRIGRDAYLYRAAHSARHTVTRKESRNIVREISDAANRCETESLLAGGTKPGEMFGETADTIVERMHIYAAPIRRRRRLDRLSVDPDISHTHTNCY